MRHIARRRCHERAVRPSQRRLTGAVQDRQGLLKAANKGMLFLDEVGEMKKSRPRLRNNRKRGRLRNPCHGYAGIVERWVAGRSYLRRFGPSLPSPGLVDSRFMRRICQGFEPLINTDRFTNRLYRSFHNWANWSFLDGHAYGAGQDLTTWLFLLRMVMETP